IDAERADRAAVEEDRHADEAELFVRELGSARGALEERRLTADTGDDDRLAALHDAAGDAFAELVGDGARPAGEAVGGFDAQLAVRLQERHDAADGAVMARQDLEDAMERGFLVQRARQRLADFEQRGQAAGFARHRVALGGGRRFRPGRDSHPTILSLCESAGTFLWPFVACAAALSTGPSYVLVGPLIKINIIVVTTASRCGRSRGNA